jgi:hypothetical protein
LLKDWSDQLINDLLTITVFVRFPTVLPIVACPKDIKFTAIAESDFTQSFVVHVAVFLIALAKNIVNAINLLAFGFRERNWGEEE